MPAAAARWTVPRHPACTAPTARRFGSAMRIGAQSATRTPRTTSGSSLTTTSASGVAHAAVSPRRATATSAWWTCFTSRRSAERALNALAAACHSSGSPRSWRWPAVNRWPAMAPSGAHWSAGPTEDDGRIQVKAALGWGSTMSVVHFTLCTLHSATLALWHFGTVPFGILGTWTLLHSRCRDGNSPRRARASRARHSGQRWLTSHPGRRHAGARCGPNWPTKSFALSDFHRQIGPRHGRPPSCAACDRIAPAAAGLITGATP